MNNRVPAPLVIASQRTPGARFCPSSAGRQSALSMPSNGPSQFLRLVTTHDPSESTAAAGDSDIRRYEALFLANLDVVESVIRHACQRHHLTDADEFASEVKLKLVENNYEVFRKFQQRSTLRTYLTVVIQRIYLDYRNHLWGKWRPSTEARRLGPVAIRLETLMARDGYGFAEACEHLRTNDRVTETESELVEIAIRLPLRPRRVMVGEESLEDVPETTTGLDDRILSDERRTRARRIQAALAAAAQSLGDQDRLILRLRFQEGLALADIARALTLDEKPFYRRFTALLHQMRRALESAGIDRKEARDIVAREDVDICLALLSGTATETASAPPSEPKGA
jgi:RNA polymerase sigma factor (sigma-70 family)